MISNTLTTPPALEPVSLAEMDSHLRGDSVLSTSDSAYLTDLISAAREYVEQTTKRALINQTWTLYLDRWPTLNTDMGWWDGVREGSISNESSGSVQLPIGPLRSVTSVNTYNADNTATLWSSTNYFLDTSRVPGELILNTGSVWPSFSRGRNGIEIVYVAGYGSLATDVPSPLRMAIKQLAGHWYENREPIKDTQMMVTPLPLHVQAILDRYKVVRL